VTVTGSGLFTATMVDVLDATQLAVDLSAATNRCAMFTNSITPNFDANPAAYGVGQYAANEVLGVGYTAAGELLTGQTLVASSGVITYDANDVDWAASTITSARCALLYCDALAGNNAYVLVSFGGDYSNLNGLFRIQWNASGIFTLDLVP
jgi:hypothetical protein